MLYAAFLAYMYWSHKDPLESSCSFMLSNEAAYAALCVRCWLASRELCFTVWSDRSYLALNKSFLKYKQHF